MTQKSLASMPLEFGNATELDTQGTGWFIGFSEWTKTSNSSLRHVPTDEAMSGFCAKWFAHEAGDPNGATKPISEGRTVSMLTSERSEFRIEFCYSPSFEPSRTVSYVLRRSGDFVIWGAGIYHRAFGIQPATILTLRWLANDVTPSR